MRGALFGLRHMAVYALTVAKSSATVPAIFVALGFPAVLWNLMVGQNGFLTAALIGGTLALLERRPISPAFARTAQLQAAIRIVIPDRAHGGAVVGACSGYRRVTFGMAAASWLAFGGESWRAFFHWMPVTSRIVLRQARRLGQAAEPVRPHARARRQRGARLGRSGVVPRLRCGRIVWLWRSRASFEIKAASLAAGACWRPLMSTCTTWWCWRCSRLFAAVRPRTRLYRE